MATILTSEASLRPQPRPGGVAQAIDRWIFVFMAAFFVAIALTAFIPDSFDKVAAVQAGKRPPFPLVMHIHSVLMGSFLLILLTQTWLGATGRIAVHKQLGILGAMLVPALVVVGLTLALVIYRESQEFARLAPPDARAGLEAVVTRKGNIFLSQIRMCALFPLFMIIALNARKTDPGLHKRMMILASVVVLPPAFARMPWLPTDFPKGFVMQDVYTLLTIMPMFAWDVIRNGKVHRAYWLWVGITAPFALAVHTLWGTQWWQATVHSVLDA